jgi:hypothetical protein
LDFIICFNFFFIKLIFFLISSSNIEFTRYWSFDFFAMELSQSYDRDYEFCGLVVLTGVIFLIIFFLNFILKHWVDWELTFIISFWFTFIGLSQSHNLGHEFFRLARLTQIFVCCFFNWIFVFKFLPSIFG